MGKDKLKVDTTGEAPVVSTSEELATTVVKDAESLSDEQVVVDLKKQLLEKDDYVAVLETKVAEKDVLISDLEDKVAERETLIADLKVNGSEEEFPMYKKHQFITNVFRFKGKKYKSEDAVKNKELMEELIGLNSFFLKSIK